MIDNLADCGFKRILVIGSVVKYRRGLAVALLRLLDKPSFSAIDPFQHGLPEQDYDWSAYDLVMVDMSENKPAIRSWYFDLVTQIDLPMVIFLDRAATVDDAGDMVRAGGADYIDITQVSGKRLARALLMAANLREERHTTPGSSSVVTAKPQDLSPPEPELPVEPALTTDMIPAVRPVNTSSPVMIKDDFPVMPTEENMTDEPTEVLPSIHPVTFEPVVSNDPDDHSLNNVAYGKSELDDDRIYPAADSATADANVAANDPVDAVEHPGDVHTVAGGTGKGRVPYVETGFTGEMEAYQPEVSTEVSPQASFITTGLMSILEREHVQQQTVLPEHKGNAIEFSMGQRWPFSAQDIEAGRAELNGYQVLEFIAVGGTASVFKVKSKDTQAVFAMKLFDTDTGDRQGQKRFLRGYQLIEAVNHPHVVSIRELAMYHHSAYAVMEYFPHGDLKQRIDQGIDRQTIVHYAAQIASALHGAHNHDILHRDLKPSNIMLRENGELAILDFGIAKLIAEDKSHVTMSGLVVGTPHYVSPEQAVGGQLDGRSDLYALGVILYEMLEGRRPFQGESSIEIMRQHVGEEPPSLSNPEDPLNNVIQRLLSKEPEDRYATGKAVIAALSAAVPGVIDDRLMKAS